MIYLDIQQLIELCSQFYSHSIHNETGAEGNSIICRGRTIEYGPKLHASDQMILFLQEQELQGRVGTKVKPLTL